MTRTVRLFVYGNDDSKTLESGPDTPAPSKAEPTFLVSTLKLLWCAGGLLCFYLVWGLIQERIMAFKYGATDTDPGSMLFMFVCLHINMYMYITGCKIGTNLHTIDDVTFQARIFATRNSWCSSTASWPSSWPSPTFSSSVSRRTRHRSTNIPTAPSPTSCRAGVNTNLSSLLAFQRRCVYSAATVTCSGDARI